MSIEITIVKAPPHLSNAKPSQIFTEQGGTIGRGFENTWVVEDPDKFISSKHSQIVFENGQYYLMDLSTNGTFLNGAREPVGHGNRAALKDGDRFSLGDYEFLVSMRGTAHSDPFGPGNFAQTSAGDARPGPTFGFAESHQDPFAHGANGVEPSIAPLLSPGYVDNDPLHALEKANHGHAAIAPMRHSHSQPDNADPMQQAMRWPITVPETNAAIPEDWYTEDEAQKSAEKSPASGDLSSIQRLQTLEQRCQALEAERQKLLAHIKALTQRPRESTAAAASRPAAVDSALIEAIGLSKWKLSAQKKSEISQIAGALVRETMEGLMQALAFRKKIKEEFRINVTTIQPVENNPLKFSANLDDALENMFVKDNKAYQKPLDAVREGFHSVSEHQLAVLAGIQAAFRGMIERLDPAALEQRFEKYRKGGSIKVGQKGKNWDSYKEFHKDLVNDIDISFQHLFGYDFVQAYEDQLQRLVSARKTRARTDEK